MTSPSNCIARLHVPVRLDANRAAVLAIVQPAVERCHGMSFARFDGDDLNVSVNGDVADDFGETFHNACLALQAYARTGFHSVLQAIDADDGEDAEVETYFGPTPEHRHGHEVDLRVAAALRALGLTGKAVVADEIASHMREALDYPSPEQIKPILPSAAGAVPEPSAEAYESEASSNGFGVDQAGNGRWEYFFQNGDGRGFECAASRPIYATAEEAWKAACVDNGFLMSVEDDDVAQAPGVSV